MKIYCIGSRQAFYLFQNQFNLADQENIIHCYRRDTVEKLGKRPLVSILHEVITHNDLEIIKILRSKEAVFIQTMFM
jgi:hypothetical protein